MHINFKFKYFKTAWYYCFPCILAVIYLATVSYNVVLVHDSELKLFVDFKPSYNQNFKSHVTFNRPRQLCDPMRKEVV